MPCTSLGGWGAHALIKWNEIVMPAVAWKVIGSDRVGG